MAWFIYCLLSYMWAFEKWKQSYLDHFFLFYMAVSVFLFVSSNSFQWSTDILTLPNYRNAFLNVMKLRKILQTAQNYHSFKDKSPWEITPWVPNIRHFLIPNSKNCVFIKKLRVAAIYNFFFQYFMPIFFLSVFTELK